MNDNFPYRARALFAFEEIDGADVCFFGMHVQEYGSECPAPNTRRVYIAYLDSVNFFKPRHFRTSVYHEILLGYLDYMKKLGYTLAHIWACPPSEGDDYIFHCHPPVITNFDDFSVKWLVIFITIVISRFFLDILFDEFSSNQIVIQALCFHKFSWFLF